MGDVLLDAAVIVGTLIPILATILLIMAVANNSANGIGRRLRDWRDLLRFRKDWRFDLDDGPHTLTFEHPYLGRRRQAFLDGAPLGTRLRWLDREATHRFSHRGHDFALNLRSDGFAYRYRLAVDGLWLDPLDPPVVAVPPLWSVPFLAACGAVMVAARGGVFPTGLTLYGLTSCLSISRNPRLGPALRVFLCGLVSVAAWAGYLVLRHYAEPGGFLHAFM